MLHELNEKIKAIEIYNFNGLDFTGDTITIEGSKVLHYYHDLEIQFKQTSFLCLPTSLFNGQWEHQYRISIKIIG